MKFEARGLQPEVQTGRRKQRLYLQDCQTQAERLFVTAIIYVSPTTSDNCQTLKIMR